MKIKGRQVSWRRNEAFNHHNRRNHLGSDFQLIKGLENEYDQRVTDFPWAHFLQYSLSFLMFTTSWLVIGYAFKKQFYLACYLELKPATPNLMSALISKVVVSISPKSENGCRLFTHTLYFAILNKCLFFLFYFF